MAYTFPNMVRTSSQDLNFVNAFDAPQDFDDTNRIRDIAMDGNVIYLLGALSSDDPWEVFAFNVSGHARDSCRDIRSLHISNNREPYFLTVYDSKMYVADDDHEAVFVYQLGEKKVGFGRIIL